jgi:8-amino-7-oxononanoate synthase
VVLCGQETKDYLINYARSLIYTTALGFPFLASIRTAYELLANGETESVSRILCIRSCASFHLLTTGKQLQVRVQELIRHLHTRLHSLRADQSVLFEVDHFPTSPIFSLRTSKPRQLAAFCQRNGFIIRAIMPPTIPEGKERVRVCLHSGNTEAEIEGLVQTIQSWLDQCELRSANL